MLDTRARGLHDRLVSYISLDLLSVGQAYGVLEKTPLAGSMDQTSRAFFRRLFLMGPSIEARTSRDHFVFASVGPGEKITLGCASAEILQWPIKGQGPCQL